MSDKREQILFSISDKVIGKDSQTGATPGPTMKNGRPDPTYGKIRVWLVQEKRYAYFWPIDAAEIIEVGSAVLNKPDEVTSDNF